MQCIEIDDDYEHTSRRLEYVLENVLMEDDGTDEFQKLKELYNTQLVEACTCLNENIPYCNLKCHYGSHYELDLDRNELLLNQVENHEQPIFECGPYCTCTVTKCRNRLVQHGPRKHLQIFDSPVFKSKGLKTVKQIPKGAFVCEYAGELLTRREALRRTKLNNHNKSMNYILVLNEFKIDGIQCTKCCVTVVDPSVRGNIGRYLNHSCDPNCLVKAVRVDCPVPKICIFARRHIEAFEELCFNYGEGNMHSSCDDANNSKLKKCLCGTKECTMFLPNYHI